MAKRIFITATNTDIGKTYTTKLLLKSYASRGLRVGVIKPVETGVIDGFCPDGSELLSLVQELNPEFKDISVEDIVPITYELPAAPFVASNAKPLDINILHVAMQKLEKLCDVLIIEGAGGLYVPVDEKYMMIDLIEEFEACALLVTHCSLGCINDTLLSKKALEDKNIPHIVGFNCKKEDSSFIYVSEPYFLQSGFEVLKITDDIDTLSQLLYNL
ncbi:dethiobiotin synthase [Sulfurimonas autotrophica]|uniref:ATP-dependent dethiobiotin synthetase BioD n=1 Tax=Sulfurimonas autotrophica (strain ATCC BAA-671 / DSM 16294 / JCM 11897 / OK10) TaxID=563040 RepID=E0UPH6_SULAO|nr:dethiobiotin synthase [Sulfurimonas autotrophica]ADN09706.1 dethiobiotin synthase [Sulfurimonas autotrophica DSM 16294]